MKNFEKERFWSMLLYCCSGIAILLLIYAAIDTSIWVDEAYTMRIIEHSIPELIQITAQDVHPPLYYIIVKIMLLFTGVSDVYSGIIVARFISLLPFGIMWILGITYIRKYYGEMAGALFTLCLMIAPQMIVTALEIRMYGWAMLFVLVSFLMAARVILEEKTDLYVVVVLGTSTLCAFYTHYFAAVSVAVIIFPCFVYVLFYKRKLRIPFLIMVIADAILYFPWLVVAFKQIKTVSQGYWIQPITKKVLKRYFWYTFQMDESLFGMITGAILVVVAIICVVVTVRNKGRKDYWMALLGMLVTPLTAFVGVAVSLLLRPVFVERYLIPTNACFWLGFSYLVSGFRKKHVWLFVSILFLAMGIIQYTDNVSVAKGNRVEMEEIESLFRQMDQGDLIVHENISTELPTAYYCPQSNQYMLLESSTLKTDQIFFDNIYNTMEPGDVSQYIDEGKRVWLFAVSDLSEADSEWKTLMEKSQYIGPYTLDYFGFRIYMWN